MDEILSKLFEIEDAATRILDRTADQKNALAEEMRRRTEAFDRELEEKHNNMMREEKESLQAQREEKLRDLRESMKAQVEHLESSFGEKHARLADDILQRILEA